MLLQLGNRNWDSSLIYLVNKSIDPNNDIIVFTQQVRRYIVHAKAHRLGAAAVEAELRPADVWHELTRDLTYGMFVSRVADAHARVQPQTFAYRLVSRTMIYSYVHVCMYTIIYIHIYQYIVEMDPLVLITIDYHSHCPVN